ncbi:LysR substrate-binding domain-containing protein [Tsuneonella sp. HG094]
MPRELPNLDWLRVFAATAATESFALAANELGVTPGAVSQRIKSLEAFLGVELFQRYPQGVRLSEAGRRYAQKVHYPLDQLLQATREVTSAETIKTVRLTVLPALAQLWLGPRIDEFHQRHESATLEIWADPVVIDMRTSNFDIALRYANPPFPGCEYQPLLLDEMVPVAAPALLERSGRDANGLPADAPLMADTYWGDDFDDWLRFTGTPRPAGLKTRTFSLYSMVIEATLAGRGFMMGHTSLISDLVAEGKLVPLSSQRLRTKNQFHLLTRTGGPLSDSAQAFIDWVHEQSRETEATAARMLG